MASKGGIFLLFFFSFEFLLLTRKILRYNCETERRVVFCCVIGSGSGGQKKSGAIPTVVMQAGPRTAIPTVRAGVPTRIPTYSTAGMYSQVRANPNGFGGAVRQDKSHYRYNPVGPANAGYNVGGGYY